MFSADIRADTCSLSQYNEQVNDLLGSGEIDKKKHEIKHEKVGKVMRTTVTEAAIGTFSVDFWTSLRLVLTKFHL